MYFSRGRRLPAALTGAALWMSLAVAAQSPTPGSASTPSVSVAAAAPAATTAAVPITPANAEAIGDSLMAHRRYQAAIEAYKQAPPSAVVWNKMGIAHQLMFNLHPRGRRDPTRHIDDLALHHTFG